MAQMTDPSAALEYFQRDLLANRLPLQRGALDSDLFVVVDFPNQRPRFTYLTVEKGVITGLVMLAMVEAIYSEPCFQLGVAIPEALRGQGRAKRIIRSALAELQHGSADTNIMAFHVEAVIGVDNVASRKLAATCLSSTPEAITDSFSGLPALYFRRKFDLVGQL